MLCHNQIRGQDLLQRVKQGSFTKDQRISNDDSALAQKFINTNREELQVVSLFSSKTIDDQKRTNIDKTVSGSIVLEFNRKELRTFVANKNNYHQFLLRIPVDDTHSFDLLLEQSTAISEHFVLQTSEGDEINYEAPGVFYNGIIDGDAKSLATVSITDNRIEVLASDRSGNYILTEIQGSESDYILFNDFRLKQKNQFVCNTNTDEFIMPDFSDVPNNIDQRQLKVRDNVEVYFEVDYSIYSTLGFSVNQTMDYVLDVFRSTVSVYEFEAISLRLNKVLIWTTDNDPVTTTADIDDWGCIGFSGADIANYLSFTGGNDGIANGIGGFCDLQDSGPICGNDVTSHCLSLGLLSSFVPIDAGQSSSLGYTVMSDDLSLIAHEMGHVFGSPHTHGCYWNGNNTQIDDCGNLRPDPEGSGCYDPANPIIPQMGGTIMSYCNFNVVSINFSAGFGSQPGNLIRSTINGSSCIGNYVIACPEVETIEQSVSNNFTYDAKKEVLIHDSSVATGFDPTFTGGERTIIYGNFQCPTGAGFNITLNGCN